MTPLQVLIELSTALLAALAGALYFRRLSKLYRLLWCQVLIYLVVDLIGTTIRIDNSFLYNWYIPVEGLFLIWAAATYFKSPPRVNVFWLLFLLLLSVFVFDLFTVTGFVYHAAITEGAIVTGVYLAVIYNYFVYREGQQRGIVLAATGLTLYFACTIPYLSVIFYFQRVNPELNTELFRMTVLTLGMVRYLLLFFAFITAGRQAKAETT
jgi:hypothetical protein